MRNFLFEDLTQYAQSNYNYDIQSRIHKPTSIRISDMIKGGAQPPNYTTAGTVLPEPMNTYVYDLGDMWLKTENLIIKMEQVANNPIIQDTKENREALREAMSKLSRIKATISDIVDLFDKMLD